MSISIFSYVSKLFSVIREPPFVIKESGYAGFEILVDFYFKGLSEKDTARRAKVNYDLFLTPNLEEIKAGRKNSLKRENTFTSRKLVTISHKDPSFIKRLIKGGGNLRTVPKTETSSSSSSSHHKHSSKSSTSSSSKSKSTPSSSSKSSKSESSHHRYVAT